MRLVAVLVYAWYENPARSACIFDFANRIPNQAMSL